MSYSDYRARARKMLEGKWTMALLITLIAAVLGGLLVGSAIDFNLELDEEVMQYIPDWAMKVTTVYLAIAASVGTSLGMVQFVIGGTVQLGYCQYLLKLHDGEEGDIKDLFSQFKRFADGFILSLLAGIYIFLWTLLFFIPGIVAAYKYAMAPLSFWKIPA